jgi:hypothetical protein
MRKRQYDRDGFPIMTAREKELEKTLHRLRRLVFDEHKGDRAERLIPKVRTRLVPLWEAEAAATKARAGDRFMRLWE